MSQENNQIEDQRKSDDDERLQAIAAHAVFVARRTADVRVDEKSSTLPTAWLLYILSLLCTVAFLWFSQVYLTRQDAAITYGLREDVLELRRSDRALSDRVLKLEGQIEQIKEKLKP